MSSAFVARVDRSLAMGVLPKQSQMLVGATGGGDGLDDGVGSIGDGLDDLGGGLLNEGFYATRDNRLPGTTAVPAN